MFHVVKSYDSPRAIQISRRKLHPGPTCVAKMDRTFDERFTRELREITFRNCIYREAA